MKNIYDADSDVKIISRGIASIVTYTNKKTITSEEYLLRPKFVWPTSLADRDSRYLSRKIVSRNV